MIYIISLVMLVVCMIGGAVLLAAGPNVKSIVDKDFSRKAYTVAKIASLFYGDVAIRAGTVITDTETKTTKPDSCTKFHDSCKQYPIGWLVRKGGTNVTKDGVDVTVEDSKLHIYQDTDGVEMIDSNVTQENKARDLF